MTIAGPGGIWGARYDPSPLSPRAPVSPDPPPRPSRRSFSLAATHAVATSARQTIPTRKLIRAGIHLDLPIKDLLLYRRSCQRAAPARGPSSAAPGAGSLTWLVLTSSETCW